MQIFILTVGKRPETLIQSLIDEYEKRLASDFQAQWIYLPSSVSRDKIQCQTEESSSILRQLMPSDQVVLLDERGEQKNNQEFAKLFSKLVSTQGRLVFVIGGAYGVNQTLRQRANFVWSLSKLVFPHRLMRLILVEQLYRTSMVIKNHPYHHN